MTINTYNGILAALQAFAEDDNTEFQTSIPDIIEMAERRVAKDLDLEIWHRSATAAMTIGVATVTKPAPPAGELLVATKALWLSGGALTRPVWPERRAYDYCVMHGSIANGVPKYYAESAEGTAGWFFSPSPDATYTVNIRYLGRPPALAPGNQSNWLSTNVPELLFKACLAESEKFLKADERSALWEKDYVEAMPATRRAIYNLYGSQYDRLAAVAVPQAPRSLAQ